MAQKELREKWWKKNIESIPDKIPDVPLIGHHVNEWVKAPVQAGVAAGTHFFHGLSWLADKFGGGHYMGSIDSRMACGYDKKHVFIHIPHEVHAHLSDMGKSKLVDHVHHAMRETACGRGWDPRELQSMLMMHHHSPHHGVPSGKGFFDSIKNKVRDFIQVIKEKPITSIAKAGHKLIDAGILGEHHRGLIDSVHRFGQFLGKGTDSATISGCGFRDHIKKYIGTAAAIGSAILLPLAYHKLKKMNPDYKPEFDYDKPGVINSKGEAQVDSTGQSKYTVGDFAKRVHQEKQFNEVAKKGAELASTYSHHAQTGQSDILKNLREWTNKNASPIAPDIGTAPYNYQRDKFW